MASRLTAAEHGRRYSLTVPQERDGATFNTRFIALCSRAPRSSLYAQTLRGVSATLIIGEEAGYIDKAVWFQVVVPLILMKDTVVVLISTPSGPGTLFDSLMTATRGDGTTLFKRLDAGTVCDSCLGTEMENSCTHDASSRPEWNSQAGFDDALVLYGDDTVMARQELMGISNGDDKSAFLKERLDLLFGRPRFGEPHTRVETIYVAVDPNGGPKVTEELGSETAVVSFFYDGGRQVVSSLRCACVYVRARSAWRRAVAAVVRRRSPRSADARADRPRAGGCTRRRGARRAL